MSKTNKEIHLRLSNELYNEIEKARMDTKKGKHYTNLLIRGLQYNEIIEKLDKVLSAVSKIENKVFYNKLLIEQIYADLDFEIKDPKKSNNLLIFKNNIKGKSKYD